MKKTFLLLTAAGSLFAPGCSEDDDPGNAGDKHAKITVSVSDDFHKAEGDHFALDVGGGLGDGNFIDWEVDGNVEKGIVISLGPDDVDGGNSGIVLESVQGFLVGQVNIAAFNIGGEPFTVTYKIEVDGEVVDSQVVELTAGSDPLAKAYEL